MAKYPDTHNRFPVTPKAYPASPKAYPATLSAYPSAAAAEWNPASLTSATLLEDFDIRHGITLRNVLTDCSGTGDAIGLAGTLGPYSPPPALRVEVTASAAPGAGLTIRVSLNSGHDYIAVSGSYDIAISGLTYDIPGTALQLTFSAITYNNNAIYTSQIESWAGRVAYTATRNSSNRGPAIIGAGRTNNGFGRVGRGITGRIAATANQLELLDLPSALITAMAGGAGNTYHVLTVAQMDLLGAGAQTLFACGNTGSANQFIDLSENGASAYRHNWRNDGAAATGTATYGTSDLRAHIHSCSYAATPLTSGSVDGGVAGTNSTAHGTMTYNIGSLLGRRRNTIDLRAGASAVRYLIFDATLSPADEVTAFTELSSIHDVPAPKNIRVSYMGDSFFDPARGNGSAPNVMVHGNDLVTVVNKAVSGNTLADFATQLVDVQANYSAGADGNICFCHFAMNDAQGAASAATIEADYRAAIADLQTIGYYVVIDTLRDREDAVPGYAAKQATLNAAIRLDGLGADAIWDSEIDAPGTFADGLWYAADGVGHPTSPEASREADLMEVAYRAYVATL